MNPISIQHRNLTKEELEASINEIKGFMGSKPIIIKGENTEKAFCSSSTRVTEIKDFDKFLTPKAKEVYNTKAHSTVEEMNYEVVKGEPRKRCIICQYFCKPFYLQDGGVPLWVLNKMAATINKLVEHNLLAPRTLLPVSVMTPLHSLDKELDSKLGLIVYYPFPSFELQDLISLKRDNLLDEFHKLHRGYDKLIHSGGDLELAIKACTDKIDKFSNFHETKDYLNKFLGAKCFIDEGDINNDLRWDTLPSLKPSENLEI
jgi:hypothetical protein